MNSFTELRTAEIESILSKKGKLTREERIILEIKNNPGIRFRELMKSMKITNGVMSYYIQKLEKRGIIFTERKSGVSRLFTDNIDTSDMSLIKFLRTATPKKIMLVLLKDDKLTFKQITEKIQMSPSTTSFYLKKLVSSDIVRVLHGVNNKYTLENKKQISNLIVLYHPSIIDTASENLADIFS
jgi:predicted transcriptional regulator